MDRSPIWCRANTETNTSFTFMGNLKKPLYLISMSLDRGRKPIQMQEEHANFVIRIEARTFLLRGERANHCTTMLHEDNYKKLVFYYV